MTRRAIAGLVAAFALIQSSPILAATGDTVEQTGPTGIIVVEQTMPEAGVSGEWTLIQPSQERAVMTKQNHTFENMPVGSYTLLAEPPEGATGFVKLYVNNELVRSESVPQISFSLEEGTTVRLSLSFIYTRTGTVAVTTHPPGLAFTMKGPNLTSYEGVTPASYLDAPEGLYSVTLHDIEGCVTPKPRSERLINNGRADITFELVCEALKHMEPVADQSTLTNVTVKIDGKDVVFQDVLTSAWYAVYVFDAAKLGILSGYRDAAGVPTGLFGPGNNVTLAELLKIVHALGGMDATTARGTLLNLQARGTWFEPYVLSAEQRSWQVVWDKREDLTRPATRAEVVATIHQALDVPQLWPKGKLFTDVQPQTKYAASIETAAEDGLVSGYVTREGKATGTFGPNDPINRAEMSKIVKLAIDLYIQDTAEQSGDSW